MQTTDPPSIPSAGMTGVRGTKVISKRLASDRFWPATDRWRAISPCGHDATLDLQAWRRGPTLPHILRLVPAHRQRTILRR